MIAVDYPMPPNCQKCTKISCTSWIDHNDPTCRPQDCPIKGEIVDSAEGLVNKAELVKMLEAEVVEFVELHKDNRDTYTVEQYEAMLVAFKAFLFDITSFPINYTKEQIHEN